MAIEHNNPVQRAGQQSDICGSERQPSSDTTNRKPEEPERSSNSARNIPDAEQSGGKRRTKGEAAVGASTHYGDRRRDRRQTGQASDRRNPRRDQTPDGDVGLEPNEGSTKEQGQHTQVRTGQR